MQPTTPGAQTIVFTATANEADPVAANNLFAANVFVLAPTAAQVSVAGRVLKANGSPVRNALVTLTESDGTIHNALTSSFGNYNFTEIGVGQTVVVSVRAKGLSEPATQVLQVNDNIEELNFQLENF